MARSVRCLSEFGFQILFSHSAMKILRKLPRAAIALLAPIAFFAPLTANASDWNMASSVSYRNASSSQPGVASSDKGASASAFLTTQQGEWILGGGISYSQSRLKMDDGSGSYKPSATAVMALASLNIGGGRTLSGTLGYGNSTVDGTQVGGGTTTTYTSHGDFLSSSLGLSQSLTLGSRSQAILFARYTYVGNQRNAYTDSAGTNTQSGRSNFAFLSLGAGYSHRFGRFTPYAQVSWNVSDKEFVVGSNDKDYFSLNAGLNYRLNGTTYLGVSFSTLSGKAWSRDNTIGLNLSRAF